jgi:hypothetical protein
MVEDYDIVNVEDDDDTVGNEQADILLYDFEAQRY